MGLLERIIREEVRKAIQDWLERDPSVSDHLYRKLETAVKRLEALATSPD